MLENTNELLPTENKHNTGSALQPEEHDKLLSLLSSIVDSLDEQQVGEWGKGLVELLKNRQILLAMIAQQATELETLRKVSRKLTSTLDIKEVLYAICEQAMHLIEGTKDTHIFLYEGDHLYFGSSLDKDGKRDAMFAKPRPDGLTISVARAKEVILVADMRKHPLFKDTPKEWTGSIIGLPLMVDKTVVGVMNLSREKVGGFTEAEIRLLKLLTDQAAIAIYNAHQHGAVSRQANIDRLTGLPNRRALDKRLESEVKRAQRTGAHFSLVMLDLDGFKSVNDQYGHTTGDRVLRLISASLMQSVRSTDFLARYGGDEFTLLLPDTEPEPAKHVATKLQEVVRSLDLKLPDDQPNVLNITGGIASYPLHGRTASDLIRIADMALYWAKQNRRGTFVIVTVPTAPFV